MTGQPWTCEWWKALSSEKAKNSLLDSIAVRPLSYLNVMHMMLLWNGTHGEYTTWYARHRSRHSVSQRMVERLCWTESVWIVIPTSIQFAQLFRNRISSKSVKYIEIRFSYASNNNEEGQSTTCTGSFSSLSDLIVFSVNGMELNLMARTRVTDTGPVVIPRHHRKTSSQIVKLSSQCRVNEWTVVWSYSTSPYKCLNSIKTGGDQRH